ncbi:mce family Mce5F domain protein [Mycobacteroides abscessus subsp. bolletii 1513]|uniref:Mce family Mce5F domain protein n=1 Tax=Mycobacteroides abscessus subsp. bolletii 1513 TaxID=1299321 RepID=X8DDP0_9MYCO|nr:mce family Mce5F domain protein [Mycobacteroides abscessus subsp. bolletii 1513]
MSRGLLAIGDVFRRSWKWLSVVGLVAILVICVGYVMFGTLKVNPIESEYQVKVQLHESGGLLPNQEVTLRGCRSDGLSRSIWTRAAWSRSPRSMVPVKLPVDSEVR